MLFPTFTFFAFFIPVLLTTWFLKRWPLLWRWSLLLASYLFYTTWSWSFLKVLVAITIITFIAAHFARRQNLLGKVALTLGIVLNLGALFVFKYYDFFRVSFENLFSKIGLAASLPVLEILLPIGLSFYVLRAISYLIEARRGTVQNTSLLDFAIYLSFFPQLLSGPIVRPQQFLPQLENGGAKEIADPHGSFGLIIIGLFKKLVLASYFTTIANATLAVAGTHSSLGILLAIYAYAIVIYCDFSGYSDMAMGVTHLMGFSSPANFLSPYNATSIQDFWRRWHITFSEWLRDYVYFSLGGSRTTPLRRSVNLFVTMIISGIWHGVGLTYIVWGGIHGIALFIHRLWRDYVAPYFKSSISWLTKPLSILVTFHTVALGWIFFRARSVSDAIGTIRALLGNGGISETVRASIILSIILAFVFLAFEQRFLPLYRSFQERLPFFAQVLVASALIIAAIEFGPDIVPPFIYFQF